MKRCCLVCVVAFVGFIITLCRRCELFAAVVRFVGSAGRRLCGRWLHHSESSAHLMFFLLRVKGLHEIERARVIKNRGKPMSNFCQPRRNRHLNDQSCPEFSKLGILEAWMREADTMLINTCLLHTSGIGI